MIIDGSQVLIVGGNSLIGKALDNYFTSKNYKTVRTFRTENELIESKDISLALDYPCLSNIPDKISLAFICAGISKKSECENDVELSHIVNVENTINLIEYLNNKKVHTVFLSSNEVFSGKEPFQEHDDMYSAISLYGKQKSDVERSVRHLEYVSIVRLTKVFNEDNILLRNWIDSLKKKKRIEAFNDVYISPVSLTYVVKSLGYIGINKLKGIFHLSGDTDLSYFDFSKSLAQILNVSHDLIKPVSCESASSINCKRRYSSLSMKKETDEYHLIPQNLKSMLTDIINLTEN